MAIVRKEFVEGLVDLEAEVQNLSNLNLSNVQDDIESMKDEVAVAQSNKERISALEADVTELKRVINEITKEG